MVEVSQTCRVVGLSVEPPSGLSYGVNSPVRVTVLYDPVTGPEQEYSFLTSAENQPKLNDKVAVRIMWEK